MSPEDEFETIVRPYGGRAHCERLHPVTRRGVKELLDWYRWLIVAGKSAQNPYLPTGELYVDFVDNAHINAIAVETDTLETVGVFLGSVLTVYRAFYVLLSDPNFLPSVGDTRVEQVSEGGVICSLSHPANLAKSGPMPRDRARMMAAQSLAWCAMTFLFCHEVAHVTRSHAAFLRRRRGLAMHVEFPFVTPDRQTCETLQALELDADLAAGDVSMELWRRRLKAGLHPSLAAVSAAETWAIAVSFLFYLLDHVGRSGEPNAQFRTHPRPGIRWLQLALEADKSSLTVADGESPAIAVGFARVDGWWRSNRLPLNSVDVLFQDVPAATAELNGIRSAHSLLYRDLVGLALRRAGRLRAGR